MVGKGSGVLGWGMLLLGAAWKAAVIGVTGRPSGFCGGVP